MNVSKVWLTMGCNGGCGKYIKSCVAPIVKTFDKTLL